MERAECGTGEWLAVGSGAAAFDPVQAGCVEEPEEAAERVAATGAPPGGMRLSRRPMKPFRACARSSAAG